MTTEPLSEKLIDYLLAGIDGFAMEDLFVDLLAIRHGARFDPMGGRKDGGADGKLEGVHSQDAAHYIQISREQGIEGKVERTIARLREVGRTPLALTYWTHLPAPMHDVLEERLTTKTGILVRIRDKSSVVRLINESEATIKLFRSRFVAQLDELLVQRGAPSQRLSQFATDPTVYTFLKFEVAERTDRSALIGPVVDALIYWALRETDPDRGILMTRLEVKRKIATALPGAQNLVIPRIDERLPVLYARNNRGTQRVRYYKETDSFCLPYEMRLTLATESAEDNQLSSSVVSSLRQRADEAGAERYCDVVANVTMDVIYRHFHEQGLVLAAFLEKRLETITTQEQILETELNRSLDAETVSPRTYGIALKVLRGFFYSPSAEELRFQKRLSKTSLLLISLKHSPQVLEYFNGMTGKFRLLVGSDIIVKALSEYYLARDAKTVTNLLEVAREAGAHLFLSEPVLDEVFTHLHATTLEFRNHYAAREEFISGSIASQSNRIFIRAYFYARANRQVRGWYSYINTFVDSDPLILKQDKAREQLRAFLVKAFGFEYISRDDMSKGVDLAAYSALSELLTNRDSQKNHVLAENDALMAHSVYSMRRRNEEVSKYDGFGLSTWWLTKETRILPYTAELVKKHGTPYIMRPEFLLNFLSLAPKAGLSDRARELIPTHVGLQLGQHLADYQMENLLSAVEEWRDLPKERIEVRMSEFADRLKYDRLKKYGAQVEMSDAEIFRRELSQLKADLASESGTRWPKLSQPEN